MLTTIGKWRRLQQTASASGTFAILAIDHRGALRAGLEDEAGRPVTDGEIGELKSDVVRALGSVSSAVLLDPETGLAPCVSSGALPGSTGLIVALDTGSTGDPDRRETSVVPGWNVAKAVRAGAAGVKLLLYHHPRAEQAAEREDLVSRVADECARHDVPLFLEPLSHALADANRPAPPDERRAVVVETARRLVPLGVDVLKAEFPVDVGVEPDETAWREACEELTAASAAPWVLLSGGVSFETYLRQVRVACEAGASGVMAGRTVWKEAATLDVSARRGFLATTARERMERLREIIYGAGRPFTDVYRSPASDED